MNRFFHSPHPYAFCTSVCWAGAYVLSRMTRGYIAPVYLGYCRCVIASVTLFLVLLFTKKLTLPKGKNLAMLALAGLTGVTLYMIVFNKGCALVTTTTGNVILATAPIVTAIGARIIFKEKLKIIQWVSIGIAFLGVVILTVLSGGFQVSPGIAWLLLAMLLMSCYNLLQRYFRGKMDSLVVTSFCFFCGTIFYSFIALPGTVTAVQGLPLKVWIPILLLGLCCSGLAYVTWTRAFALASKASQASNYMMINPFIAAVFGLFIGDPIEKGAIFGGIVIMLGLVLFNFGPSLLEKARASR